MLRKRFKSTKTFTHAMGLSCCFRQWRADSHCRLLHGYAIEVKLVFSTSDLNDNNWVVDFGSFNEIKEYLRNVFDHTVLVARDDPEKEALFKLEDLGLARVVLVDNIGCEKFAEMIYNKVHSWLIDCEIELRVSLDSVEVKEHQGNSAICEGIQADV